MRATVREVVEATPVLDMHTHLYDPAFGALNLWGPDELLTYHYLVAEVFRVAPLAYGQFWAMSKAQQADYIWKHLFIERSPVSEACRGVLTVLSALGLDVRQPTPAAFREHFRGVTAEQYIDRVLSLAGVRGLVMTNDPFDEAERRVWVGKPRRDPRFHAALRLDALLNSWPDAAARLSAWDYRVSSGLGPADVAEVRRFLADWVALIKPRYMAVSLEPGFRWPDDGPRGRLIRECVLPAAAEAGVPMALMIGVRRQVNPGLRLAGDGMGRADVSAVEAICREFPDNRFLLTMLSRENQHELCVATRKLPNLLLFGCWWFLNNPSLIEELTRMRFELLGLSYVPQHSDARVFDQLVYKWSHSRAIIADVLADKYIDLARTGWQVTREEIARDVQGLLGGTFEAFCDRR